MPVMKTPGVYIVEKPAFPNSVVEVATAVPAFIGYTEKAENKGKSLSNMPWRISSMAEYLSYFGGAPRATFRITPMTSSSAKNGSKSSLTAPRTEQPSAAVARANTPKAEAARPAQGTTETKPEFPDDAGETPRAERGLTDSTGTSAQASINESGAPQSAPLQAPTQPTPVRTAVADSTATPSRTSLVEASAGENLPSVQTSTVPAVKAFTAAGTDYTIVPAEALNQRFLLYRSMLLFFQNGGGPCYIVSVGTYGTNGDASSMPTIDDGDLTRGITLLLKEQEPTMIVIPDAVHLASESSCITVQQQALQHCGSKMQNRVAILDVYDGYKDQQDPSGDCIKSFRNDLGINNLSYAATYYPWLNTTIVGDRDVSYKNVDREDLTQLLRADKVKEEVVSEVARLNSYTEDLLNKTLLATSPAFVQVMTEVKRQLNVLPPAAAVAGVYSTVDNASGVWKAPANVSLNSVVSPTVSISHDEQENLNVDVQGKSINAIRPFIGEGVLIWGARTLDGNSLDWRYVSVRRTMIMLEQSIKLASKAYVFDNNISTTWVTIKSMIRNFLTGIWKRGGLAGASPDDAFAVFCGLGETMTPEDILEGILRVTVLVAVTRPAEFIEITFQQQMQKS